MLEKTPTKEARKTFWEGVQWQAMMSLSLGMSEKEESSRSTSVFLGTKLNLRHPVAVLHSASMRTISETWEFFKDVFITREGA